MLDNVCSRDNKEKFSFSENVNQHEQKSLFLMAHPFISDGFLGIDLTLLKQTMEKYSWIELVRIKRIWPEQIHTEVVKRIPVAQYNQNLFLKFHYSLKGQTL